MSNKVVNIEPETEMVQSLCRQLDQLCPPITEIISPYMVLSETDEFSKRLLPGGIAYLTSKEEVLRLIHPTLVSSRKEFFLRLYRVCEFYVNTCENLAENLSQRWHMLGNAQADLNTSSDYQTWDIRALIILDIFKEAPHPDQEWVRRKLLHVILDLLSLEKPLAQTYQITNRALLAEVGIIV